MIRPAFQFDPALQADEEDDEEGEELDITSEQACAGAATRELALFQACRREGVLCQLLSALRCGAGRHVSAFGAGPGVFQYSAAPAGVITLIELVGKVQLGRSESFEV